MGFGSYTFLIFGLQHLPLADMTVLSFLAPLFVALASPYLLREELSPGTAETCVACTVAVVLVAQPSLLFGESRLPLLGFAFGILHPLCSAVAKSAVRVLCATEATSVIMFYLSFFSTIGSALGMLLVPGQYVKLDQYTDWILLITIGALPHLRRLSDLL